MLLNLLLHYNCYPLSISLHSDLALQTLSRPQHNCFRLYICLLSLILTFSHLILYKILLILEDKGIHSSFPSFIFSYHVAHSNLALSDSFLQCIICFIILYSFDTVVVHPSIFLELHSSLALPNVIARQPKRNRTIWVTRDVFIMMKLIKWGCVIADDRSRTNERTLA